MPTVRRADANDIEDVVRLRMAFIREMKPEALDDGHVLVDATRRYVAEKLPTGEFLVWFAEEQGQIVGTSGLVFFHRPPTPNCRSELHAYILNMYTLPEWRKQGIASLLLRHTIDYIRTTPTCRITLHATELGRPIYERFSFTPCGTEMTLTL